MGGSALAALIPAVGGVLSQKSDEKKRKKAALTAQRQQAQTSAEAQKRRAKQTRIQAGQTRSRLANRGAAGQTTLFQATGLRGVSDKLGGK